MILTRRHFIHLSGTVGASLCLVPDRLLALPDDAAPPLTGVRGKTLVLLFLRGGADGLNLVVPYADADYAKLRRSIAIPPPGAATDAAATAQGRAIDLDGFFGLHPALAPLLPHFQAGTAAAVHAVGHTLNTRSHFEEQDVWETGMVGNTLKSDGWVNRHLASTSGRGPIRAVSIGDTLPRILHGKASAYAISGVDDLTLPDARASRGVIAAALEHAYCDHGKEGAAEARELLARTGKSTLEGIEQLSSLVGKEYTPKAPYPDTDLARKLREIARLLKADVGLEVAEVDYGGWDTHQYQGGVEGQFGNLCSELSSAVAAFLADLEDRMDDVLILTLSDFGRTAEENGTYGTDHGWASCMFAFGGPVTRGGGGTPKKVLGTWPSLRPDLLHGERDLLDVTDFRDVLSEAVTGHLGNADLAKIFPGHAAKPVGLLV